MSDIFISYAQEDRAKVRPLAEALERQGWKVWWDRSIRAGEQFHEVIEKAIEEASCVLVAWTSSSVHSNWVREEVQEGLDRKKVLIPVKIEDVKPPLGFRSFQALDLFDWDGSEDSPAFQVLVNDIAGIVGPLKESAAPPAEEKPKPSPRAARKASPRAPRKKKPQRTARKPAQPRPKDLKIRKSLIDGLRYVWIPAGEFQMGEVPRDSKVLVREKPRHRVQITKGFWMARTPITVGAYKRFVQAEGGKMPPAPHFDSKWKKGDHPIVNVTWEEAKAYCEWAGGRLPSEAEWEYAARGGKEGWKYPWGDRISTDRANYGGLKGGTTPVGSFEANGLGLHDVAGKVWEWCADWFDQGYYAGSPEKDPSGPAGGTVRVLRGGAWVNLARLLRTSYRNWLVPAYRNYSLGFRSVR